MDPSQDPSHDPVDGTAGTSATPTGFRPLWHRVGDRWEREPPHDLLYGGVVAGFVLAVSSVHAPSGDRVVLAVALVAIGYWFAHCYVDAVSGRFRDTGHGLWERTLTAMRLNVGVLLGAVPGIVVYLLAYWLGLGVEDAALVAVWFTVVMLGLVGFLAAYRAGARGRQLLGETLLATALGSVAIAVKYLLH